MLPIGQPSNGKIPGEKLPLKVGYFWTDLIPHRSVVKYRTVMHGCKHQLSVAVVAKLEIAQRSRDRSWTQENRNLHQNRRGSGIFLGDFTWNDPGTLVTSLLIPGFHFDVTESRFRVFLATSPVA